MITEHAKTFGGGPCVAWNPGDPLPRGTTPRLTAQPWEPPPFVQLKEFLAMFPEAEERFREMSAVPRWPQIFDAFVAKPRPGLRALVVGCWGASSSSELVTKRLVKHAASLQGLRALFVGDVVMEEQEISWIRLSDMSPLLRAFPKLEELRVRGGEGLLFSPVRHAALRSLVVETGGLSRTTVRGLLGCELPKLRHLELWIGDPSYGATASPRDLSRLFRGDAFPGVTHLGLRNAHDTGAIVQAIVKHADGLRSRLVSLDLSMGTLGDDDAIVLAKCLAGFERLETLSVAESFLTKRGVAALRKLGGSLEAKGQRREGEDHAGRYVSVSE